MSVKQQLKTGGKDGVAEDSMMLAAFFNKKYLRELRSNLGASDLAVWIEANAEAPITLFCNEKEVMAHEKQEKTRQT